MLDSGQLSPLIRALNEGDDGSRRQAIQSLKQYEQPDGATAPAGGIRSLLDALQQQLQSGTKQSMLRQSILKILGNLGPLAEPAVPLLIELLQEGVSDVIREEAVAVL